jgi:PAS domain S-box-containing protein
MASEFNSMAGAVANLADELTEQRTRLEKIINAVDDAIVVLDPSGKVIAANGAFLARVRLARADLLGASCAETVGPRCIRGTCAADVCFATGERQTSVLTTSGAAGETRVEELRASPIRSGGAVTSVVEVWRDITERRKAEVRMTESHRMASLGMLASGFSHEINTPLATVLTCVEGILRTLEAEAPAPDPERDAALEMARIGREQLLRCRGITQQFLRLSRGQQGSSDLLALEPLIGSVVRLAAPTARELGVSLRAVVDGPHTTVLARELEVQQVVMNLVLNALQACARGGHVDVAVLPGGPRIRVTDDGCGIAPAELGHIFEPFFSLRQGGTGLGLFMSQDLARGWGANIEVRSVPGAGSTFELVFGQGGARPAESP